MTSESIKQTLKELVQEYMHDNELGKNLSDYHIDIMKIELGRELNIAIKQVLMY